MTEPDEGLFASRFRIGGRLGSGGSAAVFRAVDEVAHRDVALKILHGHLGDDEELSGRFITGARRAAAVRHERLARIHAFGVDEASRTPWIAMSLIAGETLTDRVATGPLDPASAVTVTRQVLEALAAVHAAGLVHRDLAPGNVMIHEGAGGALEATVLDLGLAEVTGLPAAFRARDGRTLVEGSVEYMSPEQATGDVLDAAADLYQTGALLYLALTGRPPFGGGDPQAVMAAHLSAPPPAPSARRVGVPRSLDAVVVRAMLKSPRDRFESAAAMSAALERVRVPVPGEPGYRALARPSVELLPSEEPPTEVGTDGPRGADPRPTARLPVDGRFTRLLPIRSGDDAGTTEEAVTERIRPVRRRRAPAPTRVSPTARPGSRRVGAVLAGVALTATIAASLFWLVLVSQAPPVSAGESSFAPEPTSEPVTQTETAPRFTRPATIRLPDLRGYSLIEARAALTAAGLEAGAITSRDGTTARDAVLDTSPRPGDRVDLGSMVDLTIASGANTVPDVEGLDGARAARSLRDAGFIPASDPAPGIRVAIGVEPRSGTVLELGERVVLVTVPAAGGSVAPTPSPSPTSPSPAPTPSPSSPTTEPTPPPPGDQGSD